MQLAIVLSALGDAGVEVGEIRATGGFARDDLWRGILAGIFGRPIGFAASPEGSALGAALLGMTALGMLDSLDRAAELVTVTHVERPDAEGAGLRTPAAALPIHLCGARADLGGAHRPAGLPPGRAAATSGRALRRPSR